MATTTAADRPIRVEAVLDEPLSRWLWLVKWLLLVPHHIALSILWLAFVPVGVVASVVVLRTGRYPRRLFHFATGVLRWTWRVAYYSYGALATDRYPPLSLGAEPGYPARLYIGYPRRLPRGAALVKWWLRATPQYLLIVLSLGSFRLLWWIGGFLPVLALAALVAMVFTSPAVVLLCTGRYPKRQFDALVGFDRWLIRVLAYAFLLTDEYPPLRMDRGGTEPHPPVAAEA